MILSARQQECLIFLRAYVKENGIPPSFSEIRLAMGVRSNSRVDAYLTALVRAGAIRLLPRRARSIELLQTKDYHRPDCRCGRCLQQRYVAQLKLVKGLEIDPPAAVARARLVGIRLLSQDTRTALLGESVNAAPRTRSALPREVG